MAYAGQRYVIVRMYNDSESKRRNRKMSKYRVVGHERGKSNSDAVDKYMKKHPAAIRSYLGAMPPNSEYK